MILWYICGSSFINEGLKLYMSFDINENNHLMIGYEKLFNKNYGVINPP